MTKTASECFTSSFWRFQCLSVFVDVSFAILAERDQESKAVQRSSSAQLTRDTSFIALTEVWYRSLSAVSPISSAISWLCPVSDPYRTSSDLFSIPGPFIDGRSVLSSIMTAVTAVSFHLPHGKTSLLSTASTASGCNWKTEMKADRMRFLLFQTSGLRLPLLLLNWKPGTD